MPSGKVSRTHVVKASGGQPGKRLIERQRPGSDTLGGVFARYRLWLRLPRQSFLDELLADLTVYPYTKATPASWHFLIRLFQQSTICCAKTESTPRRLAVC
jgi:hypothetical protein